MWPFCAQVAPSCCLLATSLGVTGRIFYPIGPGPRPPPPWGQAPHSRRRRSRPSDQDRKQGPALLSGSQRASSRSSTWCFAGRGHRPRQKVRRPHRVSFPGPCGIMKTCKAVKDKVTLELTAPGAKVPTSICFWPSLDPDSPQGLELRRARAGCHVLRPPSEVLYHFPARGLYVHFARSHVPSCRG